MKTQTKQVEKVMKGCGEFGVFSNWNADYDCPCNFEGKFYLCDECKSVLKGMQTAIQNELDFLEKNIVIMVKKGTFPCSACNKNHKEINERIIDCKNALAKIKEAGI